MVDIKTNLANKANYGRSRDTSSIKYIVVHYTGNDGDTDENNGKYFKNNVTKTSAHYFVDDDSVTQSVPDNYIAYHCGTTGKYKHSSCRNSNSIGVEICDDVKNGTVYPSAATIANAVELVKHLMDKYKVPAANVIRHYDVTGKLCPAYWCGTAAKNEKWKTEFWNKLGESAPSASYMVRVTASLLNVRKGPGTGYGINTTIRKGGVYTIVEESNGWGKLKSGAGWIKLSYTTKV